MNRGPSFWSGALRTASIAAFEYNSKPRATSAELLPLQPLFKSQHDIVLIFLWTASEEFGEHRAGEYGQGLARVRRIISPIAQVVNRQSVSVVAPEFRDTEGCVDLKFGY